MIPMADNLNHNSVDITYEIINIKLHKEGEFNPSYYRIGKFLNDYSTAYKNNKINEDELK